MGSTVPGRLTAEEEEAAQRDLDLRGVCVLPSLLRPAELAALNAAIELDISLRPNDWPPRTQQATRQSCTVLEALPGESESPFDGLITHPATLRLLRAAYRDDMAFSEMSIIVKGGAADEAAVASHAGWHHDGHRPECGTSLMQSSVIFYLTDVPLDGACFTVVPGSHLRSSVQLAVGRSAFPDAVSPMPDAWAISAPAGTAIVMNSNIWHASQPNRSAAERRTVHLYYNRPWVTPTGLRRDGLSYMPRLAAAAAAKQDTFLHQLFHAQWMHKVGGGTPPPPARL
jgi:hypothetical protein